MANKKIKQDNWGLRLSDILREKRISFRKAAQLAGVSVSVIDSWTGNSSPANLLAVRRLCNALDISFSWLLTGEHDRQERQMSLTETYETLPYFNGLARIQIEQLIPRKKRGSAP